MDWPWNASTTGNGMVDSRMGIPTPEQNPVNSCLQSSPGIAPRGPHARQRGYMLIEVLIAAAVLVIAILAHASTVVASHAMNRAAQEQALATSTLGRFVERFRSDSDWVGLYARLKVKSVESASDVSLVEMGVDTSLSTYAPTVYYSDFTVPTSLGTVTVLVQVPSMAVLTVPALRESALAPRYGLPADLNGDGKIDANPRDTDYRALPVVVRLRWKRAGQAAQEVVLATWLWGEQS